MALSWNRVHLIAAREALEAHRDLHTDLSERIDPFAALATAGVVVFRRPLGRLAGAYIAANATDGSAPGVLIHAGHPLSRQRYTAAHELCHHRRDHATIFDEDTEWLAVRIANPIVNGSRRRSRRGSSCRNNSSQP